MEGKFMKKIIGVSLLSLGLLGFVASGIQKVETADLPSQHSTFKTIKMADLPSQHSTFKSINVADLPSQH